MRRSAPLALLVSLGGSLTLAWACGGDDTSTPTADAGVDVQAEATVAPDTSIPYDAAEPDVSLIPDIDGGAMCSPTKAFGAPTLVAEVDTTGTEASLRLSYDQLTAYFTSTRPGGQGGQDVWTATRATPNGSFGAFTDLASLNSPVVDTHASITQDGLLLVYESPRISPASSVLFAKRADTASPWGPPDGVPSLGNFNVVTDPFVRADGQILYFVAAPQGGDLDLYRAYRSGKSFGNAINVGELNSQGQEELPTVSPDDRLMYFASTRIEPGAKGGFDIWMSTRYSVNAPYNAPQLVPELETNGDELPDYVSPDGCTLYFHRNTPFDGGVSRAIWVAKKSM